MGNFIHDCYNSVQEQQGRQTQEQLLRIIAWEDRKVYIYTECRAMLVKFMFCLMECFNLFSELRALVW